MKKREMRTQHNGRKEETKENKRKKKNRSAASNRHLYRSFRCNVSTLTCGFTTLSVPEHRHFPHRQFVRGARGKKKKDLSSHFFAAKGRKKKTALRVHAMRSRCLLSWETNREITAF